MFAALRKLKRIARRRAARKAEEARQESVRALKDAITRKDTRAQHDRFPAAFAATNAALRAEAGR